VSPGARKTTTKEPSTGGRAGRKPGAAVTARTSLAVVLFTDIEASTALKRTVAKRADEPAFQHLRQRHDEIVASVIARDGGGQVVKWTGDGVLALFPTPSVAVERALEIQEQIRRHPPLGVRIGIDLGEVRVESRGRTVTDVFGAHVDGAARAMSLADGGHICVTAPVHQDAFNWITKSKIAWKKHGLYRAKAGEPPLDVYEPYNANQDRPMRKLRGERAEPAAAKRAGPVAARPAKDEHRMTLIRPWEAVARDGREFAENGAGTMYWFKVPLGGLSYPDGFRHFLQPALENERIGRVRLVLDATNPTVQEIWAKAVLPLLHGWTDERTPSARWQEEPDRGSVWFQVDGGRERQLAWVFVDLSAEFTPCFKLLVDDPDDPEVAEESAQIFLSTANRMVRLDDGTQHQIRIPDAVLRVSAGSDAALMHALNAVANQWDSLFW
jgi:class 3 adenylate cyclase